MGRGHAWRLEKVTGAREARQSALRRRLELHCAEVALRAPLDFAGFLDKKGPGKKENDEGVQVCYVCELSVPRRPPTHPPLPTPYGLGC